MLVIFPLLGLLLGRPIVFDVASKDSHLLMKAVLVVKIVKFTLPQLTIIIVKTLL